MAMARSAARSSLPQPLADFCPERAPSSPLSASQRPGPAQSIANPPHNVRQSSPGVTTGGFLLFEQEQSRNKAFTSGIQNDNMSKIYPANDSEEP